MSRAAAGQRLPAADNRIDIGGIELDAVAAPAGALGRNHRRAAAEKAIEHDVAAGRAVEDRTGDTLYATRNEDLGRGDMVKVDCAACHHVALLAPEALLSLGLSAGAKVLDLRLRFRCRGCGGRGRAVVSIRWRRQEA